jgi:steroid delta-isomerase-like uncharacterized protein
MADVAFAQDFAERWVAAWNSRDADQILALCSDEITYADSAFEHEAHGKTEARRLIAETIEAFPDLRFEVVSGPYVDARGERAALVWRMDAHMLGDSGGFAPTGGHVVGLGVDLYGFREGRLAHYHALYDTADFGRQMGLIPPRGSRAERAMIRLQRLGAKRARRKNARP